MLTREQSRAIIRPLLSEKRYRHSLCVAEEAVRLAGRFGGDPAKSETAGLLHDVMKDAPPEEQLKILGEFGILLSDTERASPAVWHQISGEAYLRRRVGIEDPEVLAAVRYHTTGRKDMSLLEKLIYVADAVSEDRKYRGVQRIRAALELGLDEAVAANAGSVIEAFARERRPIVEDTLKAYNCAVLALERKKERGSVKPEQG